MISVAGFPARHPGGGIPGPSGRGGGGISPPPPTTPSTESAEAQGPELPTISLTRAPHILCDFLEQAAGAANSWYHAGNPSRSPDMAVLVEDPNLRKARLALARSVRIVLRYGLEILGVSVPTQMNRGEEEHLAGGMR